MKASFLFLLTVILFSCHSSVQVKSVTLDSISTTTSKDTVIASVTIPADTASTDYLIFLLKNDKPLNPTWTQKLEKLDVVLPSYDSLAHFEFDRAWAINDSVAALILELNTGTSLNKYLVTVKDKKDLIAKIHIVNNVDSDMSEERPNYYYTEYKQVNDRSIEVFMHKIVNYERPNEKDIVDSVLNWRILDDGRVKKSKGL